MFCALPCPNKGLISLQVSCGVCYHMSQLEAVMVLLLVLWNTVNQFFLVSVFVVFSMMCLRSKSCSCGAWDWVPSLMYWAALNHWAVFPAREHSGQHVVRSRSSYAPSCHENVFYSRMEDLTNPEDIRTNIKCDRKVSLYGYLRGAYLKNNSQVHMPGILFCICWTFGMVSFLWNIEKLSNKAETWSGGFRNNPAVNHLPECWVDADIAG